jgi:hypothetical protein
VLQGASNNRGLATTTAKQRAREIATLSRFRLYKNSNPRDTSSALDEVIDTSTTAASCP